MSLPTRQIALLLALIPAMGIAYASEFEAYYRNVSVEDVVAGLVPHAYVVDYQDWNFRHFKTSVNGRAAWNVLLEQALNKANLKYEIDLKSRIVHIVARNSSEILPASMHTEQAVPVAPPAASTSVPASLAAPKTTGKSESSKPVTPPPAAAAVKAEAAPIKTAEKAVKAASTAAAVTPVVAKSPVPAPAAAQSPTPVKAQISAAKTSVLAQTDARPSLVVTPSEIKPVAPVASQQVSAPRVKPVPVAALATVWVAKAGSTVRKTVTEWSAAAHWTLKWTADDLDYPVVGVLTYQGTYEDAITGLFDAYSGAKRRLLVDGNSTQRLIVVSEGK